MGSGIYIANRNASNNSTIEEENIDGIVADVKLESATTSSKLTTETVKRITVIDDNFRDLYMAKVAYLIDQYFKKTDGGYHGSIPTSLNELDIKSIGGDLDPNINKFINEELKYIQPANDYLLCAKFSKPKDTLGTAYFNEKVSTSRVSADYQCFRMNVFKLSSDALQTTKDSDIINYDTAQSQQISKSTTFADPNIATVEAITSENGTTNIYFLETHNTFTTSVDYTAGKPNPKNPKETGLVNFPFGFFSSTPNEWGFAGKVWKKDYVPERNLIQSIASPIRARIIFKKPITLSSISNFFSNCQHDECYTWQAEGLTPEGQTVKLIEPSKGGFDPELPYSKGTDYTGLIKELIITVERAENIYGEKNIVWKKIKLYYQ